MSDKESIPTELDDEKTSPMTADFDSETPTKPIINQTLEEIGKEWSDKLDLPERPTVNIRKPNTGENK